MAFAGTVQGHPVIGEIEAGMQNCGERERRRTTSTNWHMPKLRPMNVGTHDDKRQQMGLMLDRSGAGGESTAAKWERNSELKNGVIPDFELSRWSHSRAKRFLDIAAVLVCSPILLPVLVMIAVAVFVTSGAPFIFRQRRIGRSGMPFTIYKFRTMRISHVRGGNAIGIESASRITGLGTLLRRTKLDELPQFFNVLRGEMSLVGPRPKVPEQQLAPLPCRPGLTGPATLAFAREDSFLMQFPQGEWADLFHQVILPAKHRMDADYMQKATLCSDLRVIVDTVLVRWKFYVPEIPRKACVENCDAVSNQTASICP